jgi:hypothetical protein
LASCRFSEHDIDNAFEVLFFQALPAVSEVALEFGLELFLERCQALPVAALDLEQLFELTIPIFNCQLELTSEHQIDPASFNFHRKSLQKKSVRIVQTTPS